MKAVRFWFLIWSVSLFGADHARPKIVGLAHISLYAHDFEKSRAFYRDFLGFQEPYSLKNEDGSPSMTFFKINDRQFIEISPERKAGSDRLNHFALETDNAEAMRLYLADHGTSVPDRLPKGRIGNLNFMIKDPQGHSIEIVEYPANSQTTRTKGMFLSDRRISKHMKHVGIIVTDLPAEEKFYTEVLGFSEIWRGSSTGTVLSWINLKVPDGEDYVEFMLYKEAPPEEKRGSAHHASLEVPDIRASVAQLSESSYKPQYSRPIEIRTGINRKRQVNLYDPDESRMELMEPNTVDAKPSASSNAPPPGR
ncbi:MAG: VOC family protein [Acidobacteriota bacterium]|nr:VOC family protein [Acidobacteriota bacterium]